MTIMYLIIIIAFYITLFVIIRSAIIRAKYKHLLTNISDEISEGYIIFTKAGIITDYNKAVLKELGVTKDKLDNKSIFDIFDEKNYSKNDINKIEKSLENIYNINDQFKFDIKKKNGKIFNIEIRSIVDNDVFLRYVIIIKNVTRNYEIINELHNNQELTANREKFAILGQLVSGLVHSLKTPIFALSGEVEQVEEYIDEYSTSIGDKQVTEKDHHEIAKDMFEWLDKMKIQVENISDSINSVRSQVIALNDSSENDVFTIDELVKYIDILTKNVLKQYLIILNFTIRINRQKEIKGSLNLLVQVINNLIMNSVESYQGKTNQTIDLIIEEKNKNLVISVIDSGCGIPKNLHNKIFKEIITTNPNKAGLGLFVSYSNIKAGFDGDITFKTKERKGTTIKVIIPLS